MKKINKREREKEREWENALQESIGSRFFKILMEMEMEYLIWLALRSRRKFNRSEENDQQSLLKATFAKSP